jgi:SAM-dependent methyltransferase
MEYFSFGPWLALTRSAFLADIASCRHALVLGDGDGRFTARLLRANPAVHIDALDASSAMLQSLLRRAGPHAARVRVHLADARSWPMPFPINTPPYDLVASHFFLDCLSTAEVHSLATRLHPAVAPHAKWLISEFAIPTGWYGRLVARPVVGSLYAAFGGFTGLAVHTLPDHPSALRQSGFTLLNRRTLLCGLLASELWSAQAPSRSPNPASASPDPG